MLSDKEINLLMWNVWSINNNNKLINFIEFMTDKCIDIACICETWFDSGIGVFSSIIKEAGYDHLPAYRTDKNGGGVSIIYKSDLPIKENEASTNKYITFEFSSIVMRHIHSSKLLIVCIYRKQETPFVDFLSELERFLDCHLNKADAAIILVEFNVWVDIPNDTKAKKLVYLMSSYGLSQQISEPTHRAQHTLDHVYINPFQTDIKINIESESYGISPDHYPVFITIPIICDKRLSSNKSFRNVKAVDTAKFSEDVQHFLYHYDSHRTDFSEAYSILKSEMNKLVDIHAPLIDYNQTRHRKQKPLWMDARYIAARRKDVNLNVSGKRQRHHMIKICTSISEIFVYLSHLKKESIIMEKKLTKHREIQKSYTKLCIFYSVKPIIASSHHIPMKLL